MKKAFIALTFTLLTFSLYAQMSDERVVEMIRQSNERGMSQSEIGMELMKKGVTQQQLQRIRNNIEKSGVSSPASSSEDSRSRLRTDPRKPLQPSREIMWDSILREAEQERQSRIFGHDVFNNKQLTFEPSLNIATPDNYLLGPGDEVIIDIWGDSEQTIRQRISPDGTIVISRLGPVALNGFTVKEADARLKRSLGRIYSSVGGDSPATFVKLSLGQIRSIQVHVMGEVANPGTYTVPSLASLFHVLYNAGGVGEIGSLRHIGVSRGGEKIADVDVYSYLLHGRTDVNIALKDGDVVMVPPYRNMVEVTGGVKRPMKYEMRDGETLASLLDYSGGFSGGGNRDVVTVVRRSGRLQEVHNIDREAYGRFCLADGDRIVVGGMIDRFHNKLEVTGAVFRPGLYAVSDDISTVRQLVDKAEGLMGDAFADRAILTREKSDYTFETLPLDVGAIMAGTAPDVELRNNDVLHIPSIFDLREDYKVTIQGAVRTPGEYPFADNLSIEDMIVKAGGLLESASTVMVNVYRRIKNPSSLSESEIRSDSFTFPVRDGLTIPGGEAGSFILEPFDIVTVRTSPGYEAQKAVSIRGEVLFPGDYTLVKREERLSDLMRRSGGALSSAWLRGANLTRRMNDKEQRRMQSALRLTSLGRPDSLSMESLNVASTYSVGIELDKAIDNPGSDYDLVLEEGDVLHVPGYVGTVAISGAVLFPNTVSYHEGMSIRDYIDQAGGYVHGARRGGKIVIYMNGTIARVRSTGATKIAPGCEIVVPHRADRTNRMTAMEILSLGASTTSIAALITSIVSTMRR